MRYFRTDKIKILSSLLSAVLLSVSVLGIYASAEDLPTHSIYINEVCTKNTGTNGNTTVATDRYDDYSDWVELYNPTDSDVDLGGYGLSDGKKNPYKFTFPEGEIIKAHGYYLVFCSSDEIFAPHYQVADFSISADGETITLTEKNGAMADRVDVPEISADTTYSRVPDGGERLCNTLPTPESSNNDATVIYSAPQFSVSGGIYKEGFSLEIYSTDDSEGLTLYYTTDGSDPAGSDTAIEYTGAIDVHDRAGEANVLTAIDTTVFSPIGTKGQIPDDDDVDKSTVIRACVKDENGSVSATVTNTYFVGQTFTEYGEVPIVSVSTDYDNLFDYETGIYTKGKYYDAYKAEHPDEADYYGTKGNYSQKGSEWERDCNVEYINEDGNCVISQKCGLRIQGAVSRTAVQKSLRFVARSEYGKSKFNYALFDDAYDTNGKLIEKYDSFIVRNGGNDSGGMKFSDSFNQSLVSDLNAETQSAKPCYVFLNGEFWGTYALTTDYSADYIEAKYGVDADNVIMYKNWGWEEGGSSSDKPLLNNTTNFIGYNDMSKQENYQKALTLIDVDSFIDYMSAQIYYCNGDWPQGNFALWRVRDTDESNEYADGRWRFMIFDTDLSTGIWSGGDKLASYDKINSVFNQSTVFLAKMLQSLCTNEDFYERFAKRFADIINVNFNSENVLEKLKLAYYGDGGENYRDVLVKNWERYGYSTIARSDGRYNEMYKFYSKRQDYAFSQLKNVLRLYDPKKLTVSSNVGGHVEINGMEVDLSQFDYNFIGKYFPEFTVKIKAVADEGYEFVGFSGDLGQSGDEVELKLTSDMNICLNFAKVTTQPTTTQPTTTKPTTTQPTTTVKTVIYGDANADGKVNVKDVLVIRKQLAKWEVAIDMDAADCNADGYVNTKDVLLLRKYIAGWKVTLG